jgi:hypothetical protein
MHPFFDLDDDDDEGIDSVVGKICFFFLLARLFLSPSPAASKRRILFIDGLVYMHMCVMLQTHASTL